MHIILICGTSSLHIHFHPGPAVQEQVAKEKAALAAAHAAELKEIMIKSKKTSSPDNKEEGGDIITVLAGGLMGLSTLCDPKFAAENDDSSQLSNVSDDGWFSWTKYLK